MVPRLIFTPPDAWSLLSLVLPRLITALYARPKTFSVEEAPGPQRGDRLRRGLVARWQPDAGAARPGGDCRAAVLRR